MPYRETEYVEHCADCGLDTRQRCQRCRTPACGGHLFTDDQLCEACETAFLRRGGERPIDPVLALLPLAGVGGGLLVLAGLPVAVAIAVYAMGMLGATTGPLLRRNVSARRAYVEELYGAARRQLAPARDPQPDG